MVVCKGGAGGKREVLQGGRGARGRCCKGGGGQAGGEDTLLLQAAQKGHLIGAARAGHAL